MTAVLSLDDLYDYIVIDPTKGAEEIAEVCPTCGRKSLITTTKSVSKDEPDKTIQSCKCGYLKTVNGETAQRIAIRSK